MPLFQLIRKNFLSELLHRDRFQRLKLFFVLMICIFRF